MFVMESPEQEISSAILSGNFSRGVQLAEDWAKSLPLKTEPAKELAAAEAFKITRFLVHRQDRVQNIGQGRERAKIFLEMIHEIETRFTARHSIPVILASVYKYCHSQISTGLAREFAGQKAYQLDQSEILQLAISLIEISNFASSLETLSFLKKMNPNSAPVNYLMAYCYSQMGDSKAVRESLRLALFVQPELIEKYAKFLPGGIFSEIYSRLEDYPVELKDRYFALFLEVNGIYLSPWRLKDNEIQRITGEYQKLKKEYEQNARLHEELKPRLMHYLCVLVSATHEIRNLDAMEDFREQLIEFDRSIWETFQQKNLVNPGR